MGRKIRVSSRDQEQRCILHVCLATYRLESQRQLLQHLNLSFWSMVCMEKVRRLRIQHIRVSNHLCPSRWQQFHVHGRPMAQREPHEKHVHLASVANLRHNCDHEERGELDHQSQHWCHDCRTHRKLLRGRVRNTS